MTLSYMYLYSRKFPFNPILLVFIFQEYVDYYGKAGVQHIALNTDDIISAVSFQTYLVGMIMQYLMDTGKIH